MDQSQFSQGPASRAYVATPPPFAAAPSKSMRLSSFVLRAVALVLTFIAAIVMGTASQTQNVAIAGVSVNYEVKSGKSSAFVYFITINVLAFLYSAFSLAIAILNRAGTRNVDLPFALADLLLAVLLFSCNSAATAINMILEDGNDNLNWGKVCSAFDKFCSQVTGSIVLSMFASLAYLLLVALAVFGFYKKSQ